MTDFASGTIRLRTTLLAKPFIQIYIVYPGRRSTCVKRSKPIVSMMGHPSAWHPVTSQYRSDEKLRVTKRSHWAGDRSDTWHRRERSNEHERKYATKSPWRIWHEVDSWQEHLKAKLSRPKKDIENKFVMNTKNQVSSLIQLKYSCDKICVTWLRAHAVQHSLKSGKNVNWEHPIYTAHSNSQRTRLMVRWVFNLNSFLRH